jgi:hypothetical protein
MALIGEHLPSQRHFPVGFELSGKLTEGWTDFALKGGNLI